MGQGPSREKLVARAKQLQQFDPVADEIRKQLLHLIEQHSQHTGSISKCQQCAGPLKMFHDDVTAFRLALDEAAHKNHETDHYKMLSAHADHVMAEIKGIIESEMTHELQQEKRQHITAHPPAPLALSQPSSNPTSGCATPLAPASNNHYRQPHSPYYCSQVQTYESPTRSGPTLGHPAHHDGHAYYPPPPPNDMPVSPGLSDGVFDPEDYPVPVSAAGPVLRSHSRALSSDTDTPFSPMQGPGVYHPATSGTHIRQPSKAGNHPEIRSAHRVTQSLAHEIPQGQAVDAGELTTRLTQLPPVSRTTHRAMPSMADAQPLEPTGVDATKLTDRLSRMPSTTAVTVSDHHRRVSSGNMLTSIDETSTASCGASTEPVHNKHIHSNPFYSEQTISCPYGGLAPESTQSTCEGEELVDTVQHHIKHHNGLYAEQTISYPANWLGTESARQQAGGELEPQHPAMDAHQLALHQLQLKGGSKPTDQATPCSKGTLSKTMKKRLKESQMMSNMYDENAELPDDDEEDDDDDDDEDDDDDDTIDAMGLSTFMELMYDHMEKKKAQQQQEGDEPKQASAEAAANKDKPLIERLGPPVNDQNGAQSRQHSRTQEAAGYQQHQHESASSSSPAVTARSQPFNDTMRADLVRGVESKPVEPTRETGEDSTASSRFVSCADTFHDPTLRRQREYGHGSTASVPLNKDDAALQNQMHQPSWASSGTKVQGVAHTPSKLRT